MDHFCVRTREVLLRCLASQMTSRDSLSAHCLPFQQLRIPFRGCPPASCPGVSAFVGAIVLLGSVVGLDQWIYVQRQGFFAPIDPFFDGPRQTARQLDELEGEATCVFLGDSHIMCAVLPEIVEARLSDLWPDRGVRCLNVLIEGEHPALGLTWLAEAGIEPELVVIDIPPLPSTPAGNPP